MTGNQYVKTERKKRLSRSSLSSSASSGPASSPHASLIQSPTAALALPDIRMIWKILSNRKKWKQMLFFSSVDDSVPREEEGPKSKFCFFQQNMKINVLLQIFILSSYWWWCGMRDHLSPSSWRFRRLEFFPVKYTFGSHQETESSRGMKRIGSTTSCRSMGKRFFGKAASNWQLIIRSPDENKLLSNSFILLLFFSPFYSLWACHTFATLVCMWSEKMSSWSPSLHGVAC